MLGLHSVLDLLWTTLWTTPLIRHNKACALHLAYKWRVRSPEIMITVSFKFPVSSLEEKQVDRILNHSKRTFWNITIQLILHWTKVLIKALKNFFLVI